MIISIDSFSFQFQEMNPKTSVEKMDTIVDLKTSVEMIDTAVDASCEIAHSGKVGGLEVKDAQPLKTAEEGGLGPVTPLPDRRNVEPVIGSDTPLTWISSPLKAVTDYCNGAETIGLDSCARTPKASVFDPFAPGPDGLMFAPRKKTLEEPRIRPMRRLDFDNHDVSMEEVGENEVEVVHEESLLESVYESLLDAIVSKQAEGVLAENPTLNLDCDGFKTPVSSPSSKGIEEICPGAPMKRASESRKYNLVKVDLGICRKLEF